MFSDEPSTTTSPKKRQTADSNSNKMDIDSSNGKKTFQPALFIYLFINNIYTEVPSSATLI